MALVIGYFVARQETLKVDNFIEELFGSNL